MQHSIAYTIIDSAFWIYTLMLIARVLGSWFAELRDTHIFRVLAFYTDPYLNLFRRFIPPLGPMDISPIVAFFALQLVEIVIKSFIGS
jgi:YggT family protein